MAEFKSPEALLAATQAAARAGYREMEAYSPFPIHGLAEALEYRRTWVPAITLAGGLAGCIGGFLLQCWAMVWSYPINVGHRPFYSWPAFIPVTFELTILCASLSAFFGVLALNGFPMPYHPVSNVPRFLAASRDGFFLCVQSRDGLYDYQKTRRFLKEQGAVEVHDVEP